LKSDLKVLNALTFTSDKEKVLSLAGKTILIKVGGNALTDSRVKNSIAAQISIIKKLGGKPVIVHGGGIVIKQLLSEVGIESEFVGGHRKTDGKSIKYIEMALSGEVNSELVKLLNQSGAKAVGISGKDAGMVTAQKRYHTETRDGKELKHDIGYVGDVTAVDVSLVNTLTSTGYVPVISPISMGEDGSTYNINADMFAGHMAGALQAERFFAMTNIDGLLENIEHPNSIIHKLTAEKAESLFGTVIQGGMIPKIEACIIALNKGVKSAHIINGTKNETLLRILLTKDNIGTTIVRT